MTHELAKQLHESGFPNLAIYAHSFNIEPNNNPHRPGWDVKATCKFCGEVREYCSGGSRTLSFNNGCPVVSGYKTPTLSELINACDDDIDLVIRSARSWASKVVDNKVIKQHGSTPEEAVAHLYLELKNKQPTKMSD